MLNGKQLTLRKLKLVMLYLTRCSSRVLTFYERFKDFCQKRNKI